MMATNTSGSGTTFPAGFVLAFSLVLAVGCAEQPETDASADPANDIEQAPVEMADVVENGAAEGERPVEDEAEHGEGNQNEEREGPEVHAPILVDIPVILVDIHEIQVVAVVGEHGEVRVHRVGHNEGGEEGEDSVTYIDRDQNWDASRRGVRLRLSFDEEMNAFTGSVANTTRTTMCSVRVEVHLDGGMELGPTETLDLGPGQSAHVLLEWEAVSEDDWPTIIRTHDMTKVVRIESGGASFERWTAHPEFSPCDGGRSYSTIAGQ